MDLFSAITSPKPRAMTATWGAASEFPVPPLHLPACLPAYLADGRCTCMLACTSARQRASQPAGRR